MHFAIAILESSLNLLISVIAHKHFKSDQCIAYYNSGEQDNLISPLAQSFPVVLNDYECNHGCRQFIIEDPSLLYESNFSIFKSCMTLKRNTDVKVIIFRKDLEPKNTYVPNEYGINVIFIVQHQCGQFFVILGYDHLELNGQNFVELNHWEIESNDFFNKSRGIEGFFDYRWTDHPNASLSSVMYFDYPLSLTENGRTRYFPIDLYIIKFWAQSLKVAYAPYFVFWYPLSDEKIDEWICPVEKHAFILAYRSGQMYFPQSYPSVDMYYTYFIPKPKVYSHWLQFVNVFDIPLWILILLTAGCTASYFWIEMRLTRTPLDSPFWSIWGLFLLQPLDPHQIPHHPRSRLVLLLALILILIYSSLFASSVVTQIISPRYEREIRSEADIEKFGYKKFTRKDDALGNFATTSDCELNRAEFYKRAYQIDQEPKNISSLFYRYILASVVTRTGLSPHSQINYEHNQKPLKEGMERTNTYILAGNSVYASLLPQLNDFILRCKETGLFIKLEWSIYMDVFKMFDILKYLDYSPAPIPPKILSLDNLQGPFWFLIYGCILATCGFVIEVIYAYFICLSGWWTVVA